MSSKLMPATKRLMVGYACVGVLSASTLTMLIAFYFVDAAVWVWGTTGQFAMASLPTYWTAPRVDADSAHRWLRGCMRGISAVSADNSVRGSRKLLG